MSTIPKMRVGTFEYGKDRHTLGIVRGREEDGFPYGKLLPLIESHQLVAAMNREHGTSVSLVRPRLADVLLSDGSWWSFFSHCSPFLTNSIIAYEAPRQRFGRNVVFDSGKGRIIFPTGKHAGASGVALYVHSVSPSDFTKDGSDVVVQVQESRVSLIEGFPAESGAPLRNSLLVAMAGDSVPSPRTIVNSPDTARRVMRLYSEYVGPLARSASPTGDWPCLFMNRGPESRYGVVVEIPAADAGKFTII